MKWESRYCGAKADVDQSLEGLLWVASTGWAMAETIGLLRPPHQKVSTHHRKRI
jgi:hypothetical protein